MGQRTIKEKRRALIMNSEGILKHTKENGLDIGKGEISLHKYPANDRRYIELDYYQSIVFIPTRRMVKRLIDKELLPKEVLKDYLSTKVDIGIYQKQVALFKKLKNDKRHLK